MLSLLSKILPFLGKLLPGSSEEAEKLQAQKELIEAKAFAKGRISPKYLLGYLLAGLFALACLVQLLHVAFPGTFPHSLLEELKLLLSEAKELL